MIFLLSKYSYSLKKKQILNSLNILQRKPCMYVLNDGMLFVSFILKQKDRSIKQQTQTKGEKEGEVN